MAEAHAVTENYELVWNGPLKQLQKETNATASGRLVYKRQLRKGWTSREKPTGRLLTTRVRCCLFSGPKDHREGQGSRVLWKTQLARGSLIWRGPEKLPLPSLSFPFPERKLKIGSLERGSIQHGGEGQEAAQHKHKVTRFCVLKARLKRVLRVAAFH